LLVFVSQLSLKSIALITLSLGFVILMTLHRLRDFLAANNWKEADTETARLLFDWQGDSYYQNGGLYLREVRSLDSISCEDLHEINQLWVDYSQGHFGLSVQEEIYQRTGITKEYDAQAWQRFGNTVGWRVNNQWEQCTFDLKAPQGHLPVMGVRVEGKAYDDDGRMDWWFGWNRGIKAWYSQVTDWHTDDVADESHARFSSFISRVVECNIHT
jgi:hypothetical protein